MRLYEEYFQRHNIIAPIIRHERTGSLILRTKGLSVSSKWVLVSFYWSDNGVHPGHYVVEYSYPLHDGYLRNRLFQKYNVKELEWDEYEDYFLNWCRGLLRDNYTEIIHGELEVILAAWQIFVYCYDGWICKQSSELKCYIHNSMDFELPVRERYKGYQNCLIYFTARQPSALKAWKYDVLGCIQNYAHWLAELYKNDSKTICSVKSPESNS